MSNLFKQAAEYRKKHPKISQAEAVKLLSKKNKGVGRIKKNKPVKLKVKRSKRAITFSVSGHCISGLKMEDNYIKGCERMLIASKEMARDKRLTVGERRQAQKQVKKYADELRRAKARRNDLKRGI
jgi:hypothetical protein